MLLLSAYEHACGACLCLPVLSAPIAENHETPMKDSAAAGAAKILTKGDLITTVTTEKKAEEEKAEQEDAPTDAAETQEPTTPLRHDTKVNCCGTSSAQSELLLIWTLGLYRGFKCVFLWFKECDDDWMCANMSSGCQRNRRCFLEADLIFFLFFFMSLS